MEQIGIQRQGTGLEALDNALRGRAPSRGTPGDEQGKKMFFGRMRARRVRRAVAIMNQGIGIARDEVLLQPTREGIDITQRFLTSRRGCPVAQIMGRMSRSYDQDAFICERPERVSKPEVMPGIVVGLHRKLHDRNVRFGVHPPQRHPGTVIETAAAIDACRDIRRLQPNDDFRRDFGRTGRGVAQTVKLFRKAAEIVDGLRSRASAHHRYRCFPVRRRDEHRARARQSPAELGPSSARDARIDRVHGRAVRQENSGQSHEDARANVVLQLTRRRGCPA
jgi:hypothetical protein